MNMKKIAISKENSEQIEVMLREVNRDNRAHTFNRYFDIERAAEDAEKLLDKLDLPKSNRRGAIYEVESGRPVPSSYRGWYRTGTLICIERGTKGWYLVCVKQTGFAKNEGGRYLLHLTQKQDEILIERLRRSYAVYTDKKATLAAAA